MLRHLLNDSVTAYRAAYTGDGRGGRAKSMTSHGTLRARLSQPSVNERMLAGQQGATLDYVVHVLYEADVQRGDELDHGGARRLRVKAVTNDSSRTYKRLECQVVEGA